MRNAISSYPEDTAASFAGKILEFAKDTLIQGGGRLLGLAVDLKSINSMNTIANLRESTNPLYIADYRCSQICTLDIHGLSND